MWLTIAKLAFSMLITAVGKIPPENWAKLGDVVIKFLQSMEDRLPAGNPLTVSFNAYRASKSRLTPRGGDK
jgi:hypothetical protein